MTSDSQTPKKSWVRRYLSFPTVIGLAAIIGFTLFGEKNVTDRVAYQKIIDSLAVELKAQQDSLERYRDLNRRLSTDPELMEQVVREQYNMKRPNEDVFVVEYQ